MTLAPRERERISPTLTTGSEKSTSTFIRTGAPRERESSKGEKDWQCSRQGNTEQNNIRQFRLESDIVCRDGSREHDALCARNGMQGYGVADLGGVNATITANGGGLAKTGGNLIVEKFDG